MKDQIRRILQRELDKIDKKSELEQAPLDLNDCRRLEILLKTHQLAEDPPQNPTAGSPEKEPDPSHQSNEDLIHAVLDDEQQTT